MPTLSITVSADQATRIQAAFVGLYGLVDGETPAQCVTRKTRDFFNEKVNFFEKQKAADGATSGVAGLGL